MSAVLLQNGSYLPFDIHMHWLLFDALTIDELVLHYLFFSI